MLLFILLAVFFFGWAVSSYAEKNRMEKLDNVAGIVSTITFFIIAVLWWHSLYVKSL